MIKIKIGNQMWKIDNVEKLMRDSGLSDIEITLVKYAVWKFQNRSATFPHLILSEQEFETISFIQDNKIKDIEDVLDRLGRVRVKIGDNEWYPLYSYIGMDDKNIEFVFNNSIRELLLYINLKSSKNQ